MPACVNRKRKRKDPACPAVPPTSSAVGSSATTSSEEVQEFEASLEDLEDIDRALQRNINSTISQKIKDTQSEIRVRKTDLKKKLDAALKVS
jgi:hypothetical protein